MAGNGAQIAAVKRNVPHITVTEFAQSNSTEEALISQKRVVTYVCFNLIFLFVPRVIFYLLCACIQVITSSHSALRTEIPFRDTFLVRNR